VLYHIDEVFSGDIKISLQDGPEYTHYVGKTADEKEASENDSLEA
jgi:hypothetical protein